MLTEVVVSGSIRSTFIPGPTASSIRSMRETINWVRSMLNESSFFKSISKLQKKK